ncbi:hypothetical protein [Neosynechococcus sphagnicola]|uniref:hypothetical protein n=1 Tax=Neosynechococcus sphagnicola TaxID=1501145 RepID=UPI003083F80C
MQIRRRSPSSSIHIQELRFQTTVPDAEPRNILEAIVWHKEVEVDQLRENLPLTELRKQVQTVTPPV